MSLPTGSSLLRATAFVCGVIMISAVAYLQWQRHQKPAETAEKAVFQPIEGVLVDRVRYQMNKDLGADAISTTQPVSTTYQPIDFAQGFAPIAPALPNALAEGSDADNHAGVVPVSGAYLIKFSNSQLCDANGACPIVLATRADGDQLVQGALLQINAKNIWVSSHKTNGNPDLIIDYGVSSMQPIRMVWSTDGQYPAYESVAPGAPATPLPELK